MKKQEIKLVITDIDGTLFSHTKKVVPASAVAAVKKLQEKGIKVFLCSGRNFYLIKKSGVLDYITPDGYITMNGANAIVDGQVIYKYPIPEDVVDSLIKFSKRLKFGLTLIEEKEGHINYIDERVISAHEKFGTRFPQPRTFPDHYDRVVYQAIAFCDDLDESLFLPHIRDAKSARWDKYAVDIMPKGSDKAKGILALLEYYDLEPENVLSLGDGLNDIEMLEFSGISIAMGNAVPELKKVADYVSDDIDDDGWAKAIKHYGLI
ncbi:MAG: Cof-type HAD-IIB family hydrolase [Erysipelotrichaceae bacterium]|jgi:Cof subfamily protein (haloacid dehalogenase superfamily)|nr:Cof-type HAD-IIB family hydrolase [Erysipelotrichaceae bacterium]